MVVEIGVYPGIAMPAQNKDDRAHQREYGDRRKGISYLADDVLILRKLLLDLESKNSTVSPDIKQQKKRKRKTHIAYGI